MEQIYAPLLESWIITINKASNQPYTFVRSLPIGVCLEIGIHKNATGYEVRSSAEARTSTGYEAVIGTTQKLEDALKLAVEMGLEWLDEFKQYYSDL